MKNIEEVNNDDVKEESPLNNNKLDDDSQHSNISINKNTTNNIYNILVNDDYYLLSQNLNKTLKTYHKLLMQNIWKINKILLNNNNASASNDSESISKEIKEISNSNDNKKNNNNILINILNQIELNHNNFYVNSKKILLKMNKHYNKRKKKLKKFKIIELDKYTFTFGLATKPNNNENNEINHQINTQKFNNNSNQVIINNIQNIINTVDNNSNGNINQNDYPSLLKENQLLKQKLISINNSNQ